MDSASTVLGGASVLRAAAVDVGKARERRRQRRLARLAVLLSVACADPEGRERTERLLRDAKAAVKEQLDRNRVLVEALRDALLEREELIGDEILEVLGRAEAGRATPAAPRPAVPPPPRRGRPCHPRPAEARAEPARQPPRRRPVAGTRCGVGSRRR
jgi:predicted transcriptional regulator